ncbi:MAG: glycine dehydrogenase, partial [Calditrichaeota bacterium]
PVEALSEMIHEADALFIVSVDPLSLALLEAPGHYGADVVVGEAQCFGNSLNFGGPYVGIFAVTQALLRRMPGRISGATVDTRGQRGFVLTLQTREQHIRREKATSNICSNQALNATAATVYLALMGKEGLKEVANQSLQKAHYLAENIAQLPGYRLAHSAPFFKEFTVKTPVPAEQICQALLQDGILAGLPLERYFGDPNALLIATTEKRTKSEMDRFVEALAQFA